MSIPPGALPGAVRDGCLRLREGLSELLGRDLVALWAHGAATFPDRPDRLGDVDIHAVLAGLPNREMAVAIEELHEATARDAGIEWDAFYIAESDVGGIEPPRHLIRREFVDDAWALHRAHWLAGQVVVLHGPDPSEVVSPPSWTELEAALRKQLLYIEGLLEAGQDDAGHAAFMVWNACRILYSSETQDVVVSKQAAAAWALEHLPDSWHPAIRAAGRVYDGTADESDSQVLNAPLADIVSATRERLPT